MALRITGRSSSHFTRTVRVFAHELEVAYEFRPVLDLMSRAADDYAGNPALKLPALDTADGTWFGALNSCRELARHAAREFRVVWPEDVRDWIACNAHELVLQGMATEVGLVMRQASGTLGAYDEKARQSLERSVVWLEQHLAEALAALPHARTVSFLEVSAFCFITHLEFRAVLDTQPYATLQRFCRVFGARASALATGYRFDAV